MVGGLFIDISETEPRWIFCRFCVGYRSANFIVGLSNESPIVTAPTLWNYTVCGQYPGAVADGATVYQRCDSCLPAYRYVIVQFPTTDYANFCELEVYVRRKSISQNTCLWLLGSVWRYSLVTAKFSSALSTHLVRRTSVTREQSIQEA